MESVAMIQAPNCARLFYMPNSNCRNAYSLVGTMDCHIMLNQRSCTSWRNSNKPLGHTIVIYAKILIIVV